MPRSHGACPTGSIRREIIFLQDEQSSHPTELFSILADPGNARLQILIIPGNPGAAAYYSPYMQQLYNALDGGGDIYSISQLGHSPSASQCAQVFNLQQQIEHKVAFLKERLLLPRRPPVVLIGHSIGAYIALHAAHRIEKEMHVASKESPSDAPNIVQIQAVFPFLTVNPSCSKQRFLRGAAARSWLLGNAAHLVGCLPVGLQRWIVRSYTKNLDSHAFEATLALFQIQTAKNAFYLAQHEFRELAAPADWWLLEQFGRRVAVLSAQSDMWFPEYQVQEMMLKVPDIQVHRMKGQRHDFCVSEKLSVKLAEKCATLIEGKPQ